MGRHKKNNQNNDYNNQYYGNNQYYNNGQYNNQNGQYYNGNNQYYNQNGQYYNGNNQYYDQNGQYYNGNNQYYDQSQYQQYNQGYNYQQPSNNKDKKGKKIDKKLLMGIGLFAVFAIALIVIIVCFTNSPSSTQDEDENSESRKVGSAQLGYVTVPNDWLKFIDENGARGIQYSDKDGQYIITLDALSTSEIDAETFATGKASLLEKEGVKDLAGTVVDFGKYKAYQVKGYYEDVGVWLQLWCFEAEDGYTHYVGIEGPDQNSEYFKIPFTFTLK